MTRLLTLLHDQQPQVESSLRHLYENGGSGDGEPTASVSEYGTLATLPKADVDLTIDGAADEEIWSNEALETYIIDSLITDVAPTDEYDLSATWKGFYTDSSLYPAG